MTIGVLSRHDEAVKLREAGLTYREIGRRWDISPERVRQIVKGNQIRRKPTPDFEGMLTASDVGRLLCIHINTVRRWSNRGVLRSYRIGPRGDRRFRRKDIDMFLKERQIEG